VIAIVHILPTLPVRPITGESIGTIMYFDALRTPIAVTVIALAVVACPHNLAEDKADEPR